MNITRISLISQLSDQELLAQVKLLARGEREATAALISHLAVLDERGLYLGEGCSSMFGYCVEVLHFSEHAAYKRIEVARAARKYPIVLEWLTDGSVNLTTLLLLAPHLTPENHLGLLAAAKHQRKRQVEELVAALRPHPSVPSTIRRLPSPKCASVLSPSDMRGLQEASDTVPSDVVPRSQPVDDSMQGCWLVLCQHRRPHPRAAPRSSRWPRSATRFSSRRALKPVRSCGARRICCVIRFLMGTWTRSWTGP